jgi:hypothetical protein
MLPIHAPEERKVGGIPGFAFAILYALPVSSVYFVGLAVVIPRISLGTTEGLTLLLFTPGSFMVAVDALGYTSLCIFTLFAAPVFFGGRMENWARRFLIANGILAPAIALAVFNPSFLAIGIFWIITFPVPAILVTLISQKIRSHPAGPG